MKTKKYPEEMREEALKLVLEDNVSKSEVCRRLGVTKPTLFYWLKDFQKEQESLEKHLTPEGKIKKLEAEVRRLRVERDILKKAMGYFSRQPG